MFITSGYLRAWRNLWHRNNPCARRRRGAIYCSQRSMMVSELFDEWALIVERSDDVDELWRTGMYYVIYPRSLDPYIFSKGVKMIPVSIAYLARTVYEKARFRPG